MTLFSVFVRKVLVKCYQYNELASLGELRTIYIFIEALFSLKKSTLLITATIDFDCNYYYSHWLFSIDHSHVIFAINSIMYKLYMNTFWYYSNGRAGQWWRHKMKTQLSLFKEAVNKQTADITHQTNVSEQNSEQFTAVTEYNHINIEQFRISFVCYSCHGIKQVKKLQNSVHESSNRSVVNHWTSLKYITRQNWKINKKYWLTTIDNCARFIWEASVHAFELKLVVTVFYTTREHKLNKPSENVFYILILIKLLKSLPDWVEWAPPYFLIHKDAHGSLVSAYRQCQIVKKIK